MLPHAKHRFSRPSTRRSSAIAVLRPSEVLNLQTRRCSLSSGLWEAPGKREVSLLLSSFLGKLPEHLRHHLDSQLLHVSFLYLNVNEDRIGRWESLSPGRGPKQSCTPGLQAGRPWGWSPSDWAWSLPVSGLRNQTSCHRRSSFFLMLKPFPRAACQS